MQRAPAVWVFKARSVVVDAMEPMFWGWKRKAFPLRFRKWGMDRRRTWPNGPPTVPRSMLVSAWGEGGSGAASSRSTSGGATLFHDREPRRERGFAPSGPQCRPSGKRSATIARRVFRERVRGLFEDLAGESEVLLNLIVEEVLKSLSGDKQ